MVLLTCSNFALAANPEINAVTFAGTNTDLQVTVSGNGFGTVPRGIPCDACSTPYFGIANSRGSVCQSLNIKSWTDSAIVVSHFQGNPGDNVLVAVTNPQNHLIGISGRSSVPKTITSSYPIIRSVSFSGAVGRNLQMMIVGSGFGASPPGLPFEGDLGFFNFNYKPFESAHEQWSAGYIGDSVTLKYGLWFDNKILILGFGGKYGTGHFKISPNATVQIEVANTTTCGLNMYGIWAGHLP
jgi:hypothetical protein